MTKRIKEKYNTELDMLRFKIKNLIDDFNECILDDIERDIQERQSEIEDRAFSN
jgi:hypothetical protein